MIRRQLLLATATLVVLGLGVALAQDDSLLQRYDLATENLQVATAAVPDDGVQARDELERALNALLTLSRDATSSNLVQAMERTFERTRVAVENQSSTDMAVQTAVLAGGFSRLVMDSAFLAAGSGDLGTARGRLRHVAQRLGFGAEADAALESAGSAAALRLAFEAGAADAVAAELSVAKGLLASDRDGAYVSLAKAYGTSLLIQDSPRVDATLNRDLVAAAQALVGGDDAALDTATQSAEGALSRLAAAARTVSADEAAAPATEAATGAAGTDAQPAEGEAAEATTEGASPNGEVPAGEPPAGAAATGRAPGALPEVATGPAGAAQPGGETQGQGDGTAAPTGTPEAAQLPFTEAGLQEAVAARLAELDSEARQAKVDDLTGSLVAAGVPRTLAAQDAERLADAGFASLSGVLADLDAAAGRLVGAVRRGDRPAARTALAQLDSRYRETVAPALERFDADLAGSTSDLLASMQARETISDADATLVGARVALLGNAFAGGGAGLADGVEATVAAYWTDMTKDAVLVILGILAIIPLVLLNMAFGGSNRNWRLVGWALFFLLVPVFYMAVQALADLLGRFVDMAWFPDLSRWSPFASLTGQVAWALLVLLALILAIIGLRGICVQFGLLGAGRKSAPALQPAVASKSSTGNTTIDWDEEF